MRSELMETVRRLAGRKPLIVEFFGLPGSGKTTVTAAVCNSFTQRGFSVATRAEIDAYSASLSRWKKCLLYVRHAGAVLHMTFTGVLLVFAVRAFSWHAVLRVFKAPWINICLRHFIKENQRYDLVLLDQAVIQNIWSVVALTDRDDADAMRSYLHSALKNNQDYLYVYLTATPELANERISGRANAGSRFDPLNNDLRLTVLSNAWSAMQVLGDLLGHSDSLFLAVEASESVEKKVESLIATIELRRKTGNPDRKYPRILMAVPFYPYPVVGGLERQAHELSMALLRSGVTVSAISTKFNKCDQDVDLVDGVTVYRLSYPRFFCARFVLLPILLLLSFFKLRKSFEVLHVHQYSWFGLFAIFVAKLLGKSVITKLPNVGERGIPGLRKGLLGWLKVAILKSSDAVVAMSNQSLIELQEIGFPLDRTLLTPNGISLNAPARTAVSILPGQTVNVVFVGRLTAQKGIEDLLCAWQKVSRLKLPARLKIWGDGELRAELESLVASLRLQDSVEFCGHVNDVAGKLPEMDIFVLPSYVEGNSNAVLEAMRAGLPVVATRVGGTEMQVGPEGADFLVAPGDRDELAERLITLINNTSLRDKLGRVMRDRVCRFFDIKLVAETYRQAYLRLATGSTEKMIELANPVVREGVE